MAGDGMQITIPDFDDDDGYAAPTLFGKSQASTTPFGSSGTGFGHSTTVFGHAAPSWGGLEPDSPTLTSNTPIMTNERKPSMFHNRTDSVNSEDSSLMSNNGMVGTIAKPNYPPSSTPKLTSGHQGPVKKSSFASLKNAFVKAGKSSTDTPPLPPLKNPFTRPSTPQSSGPSGSNRRPSISATPSSSSYRPATPSSGVRTLSSKPKSHQAARSFHSQSGSVSEYGNEFGFGQAYRSSSPPPVPPMPNSVTGQRDPSAFAPYEEEQVALDPRTPSDYALHAVFMRFATSAETKIDSFLRKPLGADPRLEDSFGIGQDVKFDELLVALGKIAQKHFKPVVDSIMRWRKSQNDGVHTEIIREHLTRANTPSRNGGHQRQPSNVRPQALDPQATLNHRKVLASVYIMSRALICIVQAISTGSAKETLKDATGLMLEEMTFDQFRRPDSRLFSQSANHRTTADLYAQLLGELAEVRFISVTDRFVGELAPVASGQVAKDPDSRYELLLHGLRYVDIKVYPPEKFEEGAEFMESLSRTFEHAHGFSLKTAFADTLLHLLHPISKTAQAEVNHPLWAKAIEIIHVKAKDMMTKPRYWPFAYPLVVVSLCVAPQDYFAKHWLSCFDAGFAKLKEKQYRVPVMNGIIRLLWTYLFRCPEQSTAATSKLDTLLKKLFPANGNIFPAIDDYVEPFSCILHFILARYPEFGTDTVTELLQEGTLLGAPIVPPNGQTIWNIVSIERFAIVVRATLCTLHGVESEHIIPSWPSTSDFAVFPPSSDWPLSAALLPATSLTSRPAMQDLCERIRPLIAKITSWCKVSVGRMTIFDDQWSLAHNPVALEEQSTWVVRRHGDGNVCFPSSLLPQMQMLSVCFQATPRLLDGSVPLADTVDELLLGVLHVEPALAADAVPALQRIMDDPSKGSEALSRVNDFLFDTMHKTKEGSGVRSPVESRRLVGLWVDVVQNWAQKMLSLDSEAGLDDELWKDIFLRLDEIETGALLLLSHETWLLHTTGVKVIRMLAPLFANSLLFPKDERSSSDGPARPRRIMELLLDKSEVSSCLSGFDEHLDAQTAARLEFWRKLDADDVLLRISEGNNPRDRTIWKFVYPSFLKICATMLLRPIARLQDLVVGAAARLYPFIQSISTHRSRTARPSGVVEKDHGRLSTEYIVVIHQWAMWERMTCSMCGTFEARQAAGHARGPSDFSAEREKMQSARGLYKHLAPFLESEHAILRSTAAMCISLLPGQTYSQLLEDLNLLATRHFQDDQPRSKVGGPSFVSKAYQKEELYTAVARIYYLTAHFLRDPRLPNRQASLAHVLKFVRQTQVFLSSPEIRDRFQLQRLRRYFCGTVERLFDGLATLNDSDRFIPPNTHLSLYRLCEEWCQFGAQSGVVKQRLVHMQTKAASAADSPQGMADYIERFQTQTKKLSRASVHTLASLCHKAYFPPELTSESPLERNEALRPLDPVSTIDRITSILASFDDSIRVGAHKALRLLLSHASQDVSLAEETMRRAFVTTNDPANSNGRFFEIVANVICETETHVFSFSQIICLCLSNLCHSVAEIRRHAFRALDAIHRRASNLPLSLSPYEAGIQSMSPGTYLYAYRRITDVLATVHPHSSGAVLAQVTSWMPRITDSGYARLPLLLLQSLECWTSNLDLMTVDKTELSAAGGAVLLQLMTLTLRYVDSYAEQISSMWTRLLDSPHQHNGHAAIRFLLEQSQKIGSPAYAACAAKVVACLVNSGIGMQLLSGLCGVIEPARILPDVDHKLSFPAQSDADIWSTLDALFGDEPRLILGTGQYAMLFLSDIAPQRPWENAERLPIILHAVVSHLDHRNPFVQQRARHMLVQILRAWIPAYEELELGVAVKVPSLQNDITVLEKDLQDSVWTEEDLQETIMQKMQDLTARVLHILQPLVPTIATDWGSLALTWATGCAVRLIAFRSLQIFRSILPPITKDDLGILIGRLSNTISGEDEQIQDYSVEIIDTLTALCSTTHIDTKLLPQIFWCGMACLSTTSEKEFTHTVTLMNVLLDKLVLSESAVEDLLLSRRPSDWKGSSAMQPAVLTGLRTSVAYKPTFKLLQRMSEIGSGAIIDPTSARLRDIYTALLPWCLQDMTSQVRDPTISAFATTIAAIAEAQEKPSLARIMVSFVKARFRTKDDFLRQSVMSLREHFSAEYWVDVVTLLIGLVLNGERWLRIQTLNVLKILFQQKTPTNPVELLGSELLMPLLRLVDSDVASQALEVLEEPMVISGGLAAKHVLRMSMHMAPSSDEVDSQAEVFGVPLDSGWCVPKMAEAQKRCRANVEAVFDTCKSSMRPSRIHFHPESDMQAQQMFSHDIHDSPDDEVGDLVQDLHELSSFFQAESAPSPRRASPPRHVTMPPTQSKVARWAAILAKSQSGQGGSDIPQTPFLDVFRVDHVDDEWSDHSGNGSDSDVESDPFYYDSPEFHMKRFGHTDGAYRAPNNGHAISHDR